MLKLTASFSKKVPVEGTDYSSQSFHAAVEVEIPDGLAAEQLQGRIHETFELVRSSVEAELNGGGAPAQPAPARFPQPAGQAASPKQLNYLRDMAVKNGMTPQQLDDEARRQFGIPDTQGLTRQQASAMIEQYGGTSRPPRRKAA